MTFSQLCFPPDTHSVVRSGGLDFHYSRNINPTEPLSPSLQQNAQADSGQAPGSPKESRYYAAGLRSSVLGALGSGIQGEDLGGRVEDLDCLRLGLRNSLQTSSQHFLQKKEGYCLNKALFLPFMELWNGWDGLVSRMLFASKYCGKMARLTQAHISAFSWRLQDAELQI